MTLVTLDLLLKLLIFYDLLLKLIILPLGFSLSESYGGYSKCLLLLVMLCVKCCFYHVHYEPLIVCTRENITKCTINYVWLDKIMVK